MYPNGTKIEATEHIMVFCSALGSKTENQGVMAIRKGAPGILRHIDETNKELYVVVFNITPFLDILCRLRPDQFKLRI